jgi:hypothetical protein
VLFVSDELCFAFLMEWAVLDIVQLGVLCYLWTGCVMEDGGWQVQGRASNLEKLSFLIAESLSFREGRKIVNKIYVCISV